MSETLTLPSKQGRDSIFLWLLIAWLGFALLPSWSLDYGLTDSTSDEILAAYGWHGLNVSWLWYLLPSVLFFRSLTPASRDQRGRHYTDIAIAVLTAVVAVVSAVWEGKGLGYSAIVLFISLGMIMTLALKRLEWLGGDQFVIGSLIAVVGLIALFIVFPSVAIFIPMFTDNNGDFAPFAFVSILTQSHIVQVIWNSVMLSLAVGAGCTFFGLILAIY
ncbi:TPA: iron ABC transporter permease, partial [Klebsiella pneumoniae]|nr:iron ABC transporter permease [Klebsiella pneumoniae]